jgi:hypothetical protein
MLCPPIRLVLIRRLGHHQSEVVNGLSGFFYRPLGGIILIGVGRLLIVTVTRTHPCQLNRVKHSVNYTQIIITKEAREHHSNINNNNNVLNIYVDDKVII